MIINKKWLEFKSSQFAIYFLNMISVAILLLCFGAVAAYAQDSTIKISEGADWRYFKGITTPPNKWYDNDFDDSNWHVGLSGFGYGLGSNRTYLADMPGKYLTVYARKHFTINNYNAISKMTLSVTCDGPFIAYLNGIEVIRTKNKSNRTLNIPQAVVLDISGLIHELLPGKNIISIQCSNENINSDNYTFTPLFETIAHEGGL